MPQGYSCNACNAEFEDEATQKAHYRSDWHRYNLQRRVAGVPGVTEGLFNLRLEALARERKSDERLLYKCISCGKEYATEKAHAQHLKSKSHISKAAAEPVGRVLAVIRPAPARQVPSDRIEEESATRRKSLPSRVEEEEEDESDEEWEEVDEEDEGEMLENDVTMEEQEEEEDEEDTWDVKQCFFCDLRPDETIEGCVEHMHKAHGFFIPDSEYLKDPEGLLMYLALKVTKGHMCLYCDTRGKRFQSKEAVRKHMLSKSHCKLWYGEGDDEGAEEELEGYYDFSSSYTVEGSDPQALSLHMEAPVALTSGGLELVMKSADGKTAKTIGSRELARYYRQRPKPSESRQGVLVSAVVAKYRSLGLATSNPGFRRKTEEMRKRPSARAEVMRSRIALKNNVIRNLPKNCTH